MQSSVSSHGKIQNKGSAVLFRNRYLELLLTKAPPLLIWSMYLPLITWMLYHIYTGYEVPALKIAGLFILSFFGWTLFEYVAHRFIFHWISDNANIQKMAYVFHGNHHHYPRDRMRLFMPPVPSIVISSIIFGSFYLGFGYYAFVIFPGFILGYLTYASMHYAIHAYAPPFKWLKPLWRQHHLHHYKDEHRGFGVSNLFWDKVFGTAFQLDKIKDNKEEVNKLMFEKKK